MSRPERKAMVRRDVSGLSLSRQCEILSISRSSLYYRLRGESPANLALMRRIDELFLKHPFYGSRHLHELTDGFHAERVIGEWIGFYNTERPHSSLGGKTPEEAYAAGQPVDMLDKTTALPTSPQAQQQKSNMINRILTA